MYRLCCLILWLSLPFWAKAQVKYEQEFRIASTAVPGSAMHFVDSLGFHRKVKWYQEVSADATSIEAKVKCGGHRYSIEFSPDGALQDVEIEIDWSELDNEAKDVISSFLDQEYPKHSIGKVQLQYVGTEQAILEDFRSGGKVSVVDINYEIIVIAKIDHSFKVFEYLFAADGSYRQHAKVVLKNSDYIEY